MISYVFVLFVGIFIGVSLCLKTLEYEIVKKHKTLVAINKKLKFIGKVKLSENAEARERFIQEMNKLRDLH